jgi:hypothetical protein
MIQTRECAMPPTRPGFISVKRRWDDWQPLPVEGGSQRIASHRQTSQIQLLSDVWAIDWAPVQGNKMQRSGSQNWNRREIT